MYVPRHACRLWNETRSGGKIVKRSQLAPSESSALELICKPSTDKNTRIKLEPENVEKGLAQLVLTVLELLRQLMEKQAVHRIETGGLTDAQIERMGTTFLKLEEKVTELREHFELEKEDLNINLGPLGNLV